MKIWKFYLLSVLLNTLPTVSFYIFAKARALAGGYTTLSKYDPIGFFLTISMFLISCLFNLSFFFLIKKSVRNSKIKSLLSYYLSSICCFIISVSFTCWLITINPPPLTTQKILTNLIDGLWFVHISFFINFFLALFYRIKNRL